MPTTIKDADGKDLEVFTAEEVKAQNDAALAAYQQEHPDQSAALQAAEEAKVAAEKALADAAAAGGDTKDENIKGLRTALATANANIEKVKTDALAAIESVKNAPTEEYRAELLANVARGDKTVQEKIEIRYKELSGMPSNTKAEVRARMEAATKLAVDNYTPGMLDGGVTGMGARGNGGMPRAGGNEVHPNENAAAIASALGITEEQAKAHAPKPGQPGYQA